MTDLVRVTTLRQMTRCATSPLLELSELQEDGPTHKASTESVPLIGEEFIRNDIENVQIPHGMEAFADNLDQVFLSPPAKGETWVEGLWRNCFNTMGRFNFLSRIRRSQIYHNTTEAVLKTDYYSRIIFPLAFIILNT